MKLTILLLLTITSLASLGSEIKSFTLENGKTVDLKHEVKLVFEEPNGKIEMIELKNGDIHYDTDIKSINLKQSEVFKFETILGNTILRASGDGSGGG